MPLDRLRDCVTPVSSCLARPAYSTHCGPSYGEVSDQFNHFQGLARGDSQRGWVIRLGFSEFYVVMPLHTEGCFLALVLVRP